MKCGKCQRQMTADEPAYHLFISIDFYPHRRMCCADCEDEKAKSETCRTRWLPPLPCHRCSRPVYLDRPLRRGVKHTFCSDECRKSVYNAEYRRRHPRLRIKRKCER